MRVSELMTRDVFACSPEDHVNGILEIMRRRRFRHVPVVDESGNVVGLLADRDIRNVSFASGKHAQSLGDLVVADIRAREVMAEDPLTIEADESIRDALTLMKEKRVGSLPVLEDGKLAGIITVIDFLKLLERLFDA
ncbi:MAG: CBS domain-containing protein [Planctomycetota bacterium]|jgi:acetoin utilization protein AcuB